MWRFEIHDRFESCADAWRALEERGRCTLFQTQQWTSLWFEEIGRHGGARPVIVLGYRDGEREPGLLLPLSLVRRFRTRIVEFMGGDAADYGGPVLDARGAEAPFASAALLQALRAHGLKFDILRLNRMLDDLEGLPNFLARWPGAETITLGHPVDFAPYPDWESYYDGRISKSFRAHTARQGRRLAREGEVRLELKLTGEAALQATRKMIEQKRARYAGRGADSLAVPEHQRFLEALALQGTASGLIHVSRLMVGEEMVAVHLGGEHRGRYYWLMPSYAGGKWSKLSPGRQLLVALMKDAYERKLRYFDFTVGNEAYKEDWDSFVLPTHTWERATSLLGHAFYAARFVRRELEKVQHQVKALRERRRAASNR